MARIVLVVHQFLPRYFTGTEQYVLAVALELRARGHEVSVVALEPDFAERTPFFEATDEEVEGLPVHRLRFWYHLDRDFERMEYRHPLVAERFRRHLEQVRPDVVHAFHVRYLGVDLLAEARALDIPLAVHLMDFWFLCPAVTLLRPDGALCDGPPEGGLGCIACVRGDLANDLERLDLMEPLRKVHSLLPAGSAPNRNSRVARAATLFERPRVLRDALLGADAILAPSRFLKQRFVANGYPDNRIEVLTYGVDPARLAGAERAPRPENAPLRLGFVGSIAPHKGTHVLIDAVLAARDADLELQVFGRLDDFPDYSRPLAERSAADPRIHFPGPFPRQELGRTLASLDLLVVPSLWYENTPFVMLEAFAAGVPVLASDLGGLSELVRHEVDGELFVPGDAADLARRLRRLAAEPARLAGYAQATPAVKSIQDNAVEIEAVHDRIRAAARKPAP